MVDRSLTVPAGWFATTAAMPDHCAKHGRPVARRVGFDLQSRPQSQHGRAASGNVLGAAARMSEMASKTKITKLRAWPLCPACHRTHRLLRLAAAVLFWGGLLALVGAIAFRVVTGETETLLLVPMVGGFFAMIAAGFVFGLSGLARLIGAQTSLDGSAVIITDPHPRFADELTALLRATPR